MASGTLDGAIPDIQVAYAGASVADHTETIDYDTIFGNPDKTNCPIILCSLLGAGCGQAITTAYPNFANEVYIDADGKTLGRLATQVADVLRGKDRATFTPHTDSGDYVIIINAEKIHLTGNKWEDKEYRRYTGWMGGYKVRTAKEMLQKHPTEIITKAVQGMLPKNRLSRQIIKKLKVYVGDKHPHQAQLA